MAKTLLDILTAKGAIDLVQTSEIRKEAKEKNVPFDDVLYQYGVTEPAVAEAKSELTGYPVRKTSELPLSFESLHDIPEDASQFYKMIPLGKNEGYFDVGMLYPDDVAAQEALKFIAARVDLPPRIFIITPSDFKHFTKGYKSLSGEVSKALGQFEEESDVFAKKVETPVHAGEETIQITEDAPVTKIVSVILRHAVEGHASDIHIEPSRTNLRVRFRVDGDLHTSLLLPSNTHSALLTRIKVMTNLKIDETRIPQDGRFHVDLSGREIDFRVSTLPTAFGEKVVIRILDPSGALNSLQELGLDGKNFDALMEGTKRPYGMILITGPTGSGKSTTLYAILKTLNKEDINIISLEDPIEYYVEGVSQSQIRPEIGYDFASGLRHILRQDPDVILVGEIRDKETASLAIHAALTGHLVFSTLHTNTSLGVIPRLLDMGVDPFLIPPTLILTVGQRLVQKLCPDTNKKIKLTGKIKDLITKEIETMPTGIKESLLNNLPAEISQAEASSGCPKGTRGRIGVFETFVMTPELEQVILSGPSETKIKQEAERQGMISMRQDGISKVLRGTIGLEELLEAI